MPVPLIDPGGSVATGVSRRSYRRRLIRELGGTYAFGTVTTQASGLEAERYLISTGLRGDQRGRDFFDGLYCYVSVGPTQRKLLNGAYEGARGVVAMDDLFDAVLPTGTFFELSVLPADPWAGADGLNDILNEALETLPVLDWLPLTVVALQTQYSLANFAPFPIKDVVAVAEPRTSTTQERRVEIPRGSWEIDFDGEAPTLSFRHLPAKAGDVIEVGLHRPASTRIKQSGTWANTSAGLTAETDEALYDEGTVVRAALPIARERLARLREVGSEARAELLGEADEARVGAIISKWAGGFRRHGGLRVGAIGRR